MLIVIALILIAVILLWKLISITVKKRNEFETLRQSVKTGLSNISIQEEELNRALGNALNIAKLNHKTEIDKIAQLTIIEQLNQLRFLGERFPDLANSGSYLMAQENSYHLSENIRASKELLNGNIDRYNKAISAFPANILAGIFGYKQEKRIDEERMEQNRAVSHDKIDFSQF